MLDHFGIISPFYDRLIGSKDPKRLLSLLDLPKVGNLLDAGGGTGRVGISLCPYTSQIVVADLSHKMLLQAVRKNGLQPVCSPSESLPFPDGIFDRIIMVDALHHIEDVQRTVTEFWRLIKPGGRIVIEEPDIHSVAVKFMAFIEKLIFMRSHFLSPEKMADLFSFTEVKPIVHTEENTAWIVINKPALI